MPLTAQKRKMDLIFEVDSFILADALNVNSGTDTYVVLHPLNNQIMISNLNGDYAMYKLIDSDAFASFSYAKEISDDMIGSDGIDYYVFDKTALVQLVNKINGLVRISVDSSRSTVRKIYVEDVDGVDVKFSGNVVLSDQTISKNRASSIFLQYFHENRLIIPKIYLAKNDFHIFTLRKGVDFNPLIVNAKGNDQIRMSLISLNDKTAELKIQNNALESSFSSDFAYLLFQSTDNETLLKNAYHKSTEFKNGYNPKVIQNILRFASGNYSYLVVLTLNDDNYFLFGSFDEVKNLEGQSFTIRTIVNPFIEELADELDLSDIDVNILE